MLTTIKVYYNLKMKCIMQNFKKMHRFAHTL